MLPLRKIKLLSRLESSNGQKWIDLYEDTTFPKTTYYYTMYNVESYIGRVDLGGGGNMGYVTLEQAAAKVCEIAATMGRLYRVDLTTLKENTND